MKKLIICLTLMSIMAACGKKNSSGHSDLPGGNPRSNPLQTRPLEITQRDTVNFLRVEQMVYRYNCSGQMTSNKFETQNSLSKRITVNYENRRNTWDFEVINRRTNKGIKMRRADSKGSFVIDYAPTLLHLQVKDGLNDIEYIFKRCTRVTTGPNGEKVCSGVLEVEKEGIVQIDVTYASTNIPEARHIHPDPKSCRR